MSTQWSYGDSSTVQQGQYDRNSGYAGSDRSVSQKEKADKMVVEIYKLPFFRQIAESCIKGGGASCTKGAGGSFMAHRERPSPKEEGKKEVFAAYDPKDRNFRKKRNFPYKVKIDSNPVGAHNTMVLYAGITNQIAIKLCKPAKDALKYCDKFLSVFPTSADTNKIHATLAWPGGLLLVVLESLMFISSFDEENAFKLASIFYHFSPEILLTYGVADKISLLQKRDIRRSQDQLAQRAMLGGAGKKPRAKKPPDDDEDEEEEDEDEHEPKITEKSESLMTSLFLYEDSVLFKSECYRIYGGKPLEYANTISLLAALGVLGQGCIPAFRQIIFKTRNTDQFREHYDSGIKICVYTFNPMRRIANIDVGAEHHLAFFPHFVDLLEELLKLHEYKRLKTLYRQGYALFEFFEKFVTKGSTKKDIDFMLEKFCKKFTGTPDYAVYDTIRTKLNDIGLISERIILTDTVTNAAVKFGVVSLGSGVKPPNLGSVSSSLLPLAYFQSRNLGQYSSNVAPNPNQTFLQRMGVNKVTLSQKISKDTTLLLGFMLVYPYNYHRFRNLLLEREELEALYPIFVKWGYIVVKGNVTVLLFNGNTYVYDPSIRGCEEKDDFHSAESLIQTLSLREVEDINEFFQKVSTKIMRPSCNSDSVKEMAVLVSLVVRMVENIDINREDTDFYRRVIQHNKEKYSRILQKLRLDPTHVKVSEVYDSTVEKYHSARDPRAAALAEPDALVQLIAQTSATFFGIKLRDDPEKKTCDSDSTPALLIGENLDHHLNHQEVIDDIVDHSSAPADAPAAAPAPAPAPAAPAPAAAAPFVFSTDAPAGPVPPFGAGFVSVAPFAGFGGPAAPAPVAPPFGPPATLVTTPFAGFGGPPSGAATVAPARAAALADYVARASGAPGFGLAAARASAGAFGGPPSAPGLAASSARDAVATGVPLTPDSFKTGIDRIDTTFLYYYSGFPRESMLKISKIMGIIKGSDILKDFFDSNNGVFEEVCKKIFNNYLITDHFSIVLKETQNHKKFVNFIKDIKTRRISLKEIYSKLMNDVKPLGPLQNHPDEVRVVLRHFEINQDIIDSITSNMEFFRSLIYSLKDFDVLS